MGKHQRSPFRRRKMIIRESPRGRYRTPNKGTQAKGIFIFLTTKSIAKKRRDSRGGEGDGSMFRRRPEKKTSDARSTKGAGWNDLCFWGGRGPASSKGRGVNKSEGASRRKKRRNSWQHTIQPFGGKLLLIKDGKKGAKERWKSRREESCFAPHKGRKRLRTQEGNHGNPYKDAGTEGPKPKRKKCLTPAAKKSKNRSRSQGGGRMENRGAVMKKEGFRAAKLQQKTVKKWEAWVRNAIYMVG